MAGSNRGLWKWRIEMNNGIHIYIRQKAFLFCRVFFFDRTYNESMKGGMSDAEKYERGVRLY